MHYQELLTLPGLMKASTPRDKVEINLFFFFPVQHVIVLMFDKNWEKSII